MENAAEALKIAGAVLLFVVALTLSISSLSQANQAVSTITTMYDKEARYGYLAPSRDLTRTVGIETIIPTMYKAYDENIKIVFQDATGAVIPIYYKTNQYGKRVDEEEKAVGSTDPRAVTIDCIDLSEEGFAKSDSAINHLNMILAGRDNWEKQYKDKDDKESQEMLAMLDDNKYGNQFMLGSYPNGFYEYLSQHTFTENLGEYYQGSDSTKIKKRIIVYKLVR